MGGSRYDQHVYPYDQYGPCHPFHSPLQHLLYDLFLRLLVLQSLWLLLPLLMVEAANEDLDFGMFP